MTEPTQPTATSTAVPSEPVTRSSVTESRTVEQPEIAVNSSFGEKNNWSHGLFSCLDGGLGAHNYLCLKTTICPCFTYGRMEERLRDPTLKNYQRINFDCYAFCLAGSWAFNYVKRGEIRKKYSIQGSREYDCLESAFCGCCVLIQEEKEIIAHQAINDKGYKKTPGMTAAVQ